MWLWLGGQNISWGWVTTVWVGLNTGSEKEWKHFMFEGGSYGLKVFIIRNVKVEGDGELSLKNPKKNLYKGANDADRRRN